MDLAMRHSSKIMTILIFTILLGSVFSAQMIVPAYATGSSGGQIHFFGHTTSGKPPSFTSPPGFEINQCSPTGRSMFEIDLYLLNRNGGPNTVRLTMFSGTNGADYPTSVAISSVDFYTETGISTGSVNTDGTAPFDVLVPPSSENSPGDIRAQSDTHVHLKITFNANGDPYNQIHGDNRDVNGKNSNGYFFYTNDPEICDNGQPPGETPVGGQIIPINTTALLLAGVQTSFVWILPVVLGGIGLVTFMLRRK